MKSHFHGILFLLIVFHFISSCKKEGCTDAMANNFNKKAKNNDGSCEFLTDKFVGNFLGNEDCNDGSDGISTLLISRQSSTNNKIVLNNFTRYSIAPIAIVNGDEFIIENQNHPSGFLNININGNGKITGNSLGINYITSESEGLYECSFNGTK